MQRQLIPAFGVSVMALAITLAQVFGFSSVVAGSITPRPISVQTALLADAPQSCRLPWSDKTDTGSLQVVYNSQDDEFVALGFQYFSDWESQHLMGLRLSSSGQPEGEPIMVTFSDQSTLPAIAYNPTSNRYLTVWGSGIPGRNSGLDAQLLAADLSPAAERIPLNAGNGYFPSVAFNADDDEFLVVWQEDMPIPPWLSTPTPTSLPTGTAPTATPTAPAEPTRTPTTVTPQPNVQSIFAQRVRGDGTRVGPSVIPIMLGSTPAEAVTTPKVVYNSVNQEYLVVWVQSEPESGLYGRRLSRTGVPLGGAMPLTAPPTVPYRPFLVYGSSENQYLLVWADAQAPENRLVDVYGRLLSGQGQPIGEPFVIRGTDKYEIPTGAVYNPVKTEYLVAWDMDRATEIKPTLQRLSVQGELVGEPIETTGGVHGLSVNTTQGSYLVLEQYGYGARSLDPEGCPPLPMPTAPTPTPWTTPSPTPGVQQWRGTLLRIRLYEFPISQRRYAQWLVGEPPAEDGLAQVESIIVTDLTRVDEYLSHVQVGAEVWIKTHIQTLAIDSAGPITQLVADEAAILSVAEPTATLTATATSTATPSPTSTATAASPPTQYNMYLPYLVIGGISE